MASAETNAIWGAILKALGQTGQGYVEGRKYADKRKDKKFQQNLALKQDERAQAESEDRRTINKFREKRLQEKWGWERYALQNKAQKSWANDILKAMGQGMVPIVDDMADPNQEPEYTDKEVRNLLKERKDLIDDMNELQSGYAEPSKEALKRMDEEMKSVEKALIALSKSKGKLTPGVKTRFDYIVNKIKPESKDANKKWAEMRKKDPVKYYQAAVKGKKKPQKGTINKVLYGEMNAGQRKQVFDHYKNQAFKMAKSGKSAAEIRKYLISKGIDPDMLLEMYDDRKK